MPPKRRKKAKGSFHPLKLVLIGGGVFLVLLVVALLAAKSMLNGWLRGEGFRDWLAQRSARTLQSEVALSELEWKGSEIYTKRFEALGRPKASFSGLVLDGVRARTGGIADKAVQVPEIAVNRLDLRFSPERKAPPLPPTETLPAASGRAGVPDWLAKHLPNRVEVGEIEVATARISVEKAEGQVFLLNGAKATLTPDSRTGFWAVEGRGGKIALPNQPEIAMKDLRLRWKGRELFLDRCALGIYKKGHVDGRGEIGFDDPGRFDLELEISSIDIDELVQGDWRDRLAGTIHGPVRVVGAPGALVYEGTLNVTDGVVESIPVLKRIAQYTRSERFERLVLNQAKTDFRREGERLELRNLVLQSDGLVRVEGRVDLVGEQLVGDLSVGVVPGTMRWIPGAERLVFTEERNGFLWAPLKLAGTTTSPHEDLSARLIAAAGETVAGELPEGLIDAAKQLLGPSGSRSGAPPPSEELLDQGKRVLDLLTPFLKAP